MITAKLPTLVGPTSPPRCAGDACRRRARSAARHPDGEGEMVNSKIERTHGRPSRRACSLAYCTLVFLALALLSAPAGAAPFLGSPPLPAHESAWILIDGDDA